MRKSGERASMWARRFCGVTTPADGRLTPSAKSTAARRLRDRVLPVYPLLVIWSTFTSPTWRTSARSPDGQSATLAMLKRELGSRDMAELDRERLIRFGRERAASGAGPVTTGMIKLVLSHAAAVHGLPMRVEPVDLARIALKRLGLVAKGNERDRRPSEEELATLIAHFDGNPRQIIPMGRIIKFAGGHGAAPARNLPRHMGGPKRADQTLTIRDRKDPRQKKGNDQRIPLIAISGHDAVALIDDAEILYGHGRLADLTSSEPRMIFQRRLASDTK